MATLPRYFPKCLQTMIWCAQCIALLLPACNITVHTMFVGTCAVSVDIFPANYLGVSRVHFVCTFRDPGVFYAKVGSEWSRRDLIYHCFLFSDKITIYNVFRPMPALLDCEAARIAHNISGLRFRDQSLNCTKCYLTVWYIIFSPKIIKEMV